MSETGSAKTGVPSILSRVRNAEIVHEPFPYIIIREAMEPSLYKALAEKFPPLDIVAGATPITNNYAYLMSYEDVCANERIAPEWRAFFDYHVSQRFFHDFLKLFGDDVRRLYPDLESFFGMRLEELPATNRTHRSGRKDRPGFEVELDVQFGINSPVTEPTSVRGAHLDSRYKFFNALWYFRDDKDDTSGGDFTLYKFKTGRPIFNGKQPEMRDLEEIDVVRYAPNTLVLFVNSVHSLHGVSVRQRTPHGRRYINFAAECYRMPNDELFARPQKSFYRTRRLVEYLKAGDLAAVSDGIRRAVVGR